MAEPVRAVKRAAVLAALAGAVAIAGPPALSHGAVRKSVALSPPLVTRANFDPSSPAFGDRITATIAIEIDRRRTRVQTLRVSYDLAPLQQVGPTHTTRVTRGDVELMTIAVPVTCISDGCLATRGVAQLRLAPARVSIATAAGVLRVSAGWPLLPVRDRVRSADVNAAQPPLEADASPVPPTYRASPETLAAIFDFVAALFGVCTVGLIVRQARLLTRRGRRPPDVALIRAIRLTRSAQALPGPERRRALALLARVLGRGEFHGRATRLAWSQPTPEPDELETLVQAIEREDTP
jgi:hypothetical protein